MTKIITYMCDRCSATQDTEQQMWNVGITYSHGLEILQLNRGITHMWCRKCMDEFQIISAPAVKDNEPAPKVLSMEEKLVELLRERVQENTYQG